MPLLTRLDLSHNRIGSNGMEMVRQCSQRTPDLAVHIELFGNVAPIAALHKAEEGMRLTREATRLRPSSSSAAFLQTNVRSPRRRALEQGGTAAVSGLASMLLQSSKNDAYEHAMSRRQRLDEKGIFGHDANTIRAEHSMRTELMPREVVLLAADVEPKKEAYVRMRKDAAKCIADGSHRNLYTYEAAGPGPDAPPQPDGHPASDECIKGQAENAREDRRAARDVGQATRAFKRNDHRVSTAEASYCASCATRSSKSTAPDRAVASRIECCDGERRLTSASSDPREPLGANAHEQPNPHTARTVGADILLV